MSADQLEARAETPAETPAPPPTARDARTARGARGIRAALYALAAIPVLSMVFEVARAPRLQFYDYWFVIERLAYPDGSLNFRGIFTYRNEHPTFIPGFLFWLDAKLFAGDNRVLGLMSIVMGVAIVYLLLRLLPATIGPMVKAGLAVAFSFVLFTPYGLHNFVMGMSGVAWLLANLTAAGALLAARKDKVWVALALAMVGSLSYGTAFAIWPALAVAFWLQRAALWKALAPIGIGLVVIAAWALTLDALNPGPETGMTGLETTVAGFAATAGALWGTLAPYLGVVTIVALLVFAWQAGAQRLDLPRTSRPLPAPVDSAAWVGLGVYALGGVFLIAVARSEEGVAALTTSRYASVPALALVALIGLVAVHWPTVKASLAVIGLIVLSLITFGISASRAEVVRDNYPKQEAIAVAMHVGAVRAILDDSFPLVAVESQRGLGAYPFTDDYTLGCGGPELGDKVDPALLADVGPAPGINGYAGTVDLARNLPDAQGRATGWYFTGWAIMGERRGECVLVLDAENTVVGGGAVGIRRVDVVRELVVDEALSGFMAVAGPQVVNPVVVVKSGDRYYRVPAA